MIIIREEGYNNVHVASIKPSFLGYISQIVFTPEMRWDNRVFGFYFNDSSPEIQIIEFLVNSFMTALIFSAKWQVIFLKLKCFFFNPKQFWLTKQWYFLVMACYFTPLKLDHFYYKEKLLSIGNFYTYQHFAHESDVKS